MEATDEKRSDQPTPLGPIETNVSRGGSGSHNEIAVSIFHEFVYLNLTEKAIKLCFFSTPQFDSWRRENANASWQHGPSRNADQLNVTPFSNNEVFMDGNAIFIYELSIISQLQSV